MQCRDTEILDVSCRSHLLKVQGQLHVFEVMKLLQRKISGFVVDHDRQLKECFSPIFFHPREGKWRSLHSFALGTKKRLSVFVIASMQSSLVRVWLC